MPKDAPQPIRLPEQLWREDHVLDLCRAQDADGLFRLVKKYGFTNESIGYWTGIDPGEISKRINGAKEPVRTLDRWHRIADGLNMPDDARLELGIAPRRDRAAPNPYDIRTSTSSPQVVHPVDGKAMALVGEGSFLMGSDNRPVLLGAFYIDITPVTNRDYARFAHAAGHSLPAHWENENYAAHASNHPVVNVTHPDARAYAEWAGKRLPTEAEWEKTARGRRGDAYPWGNRPTVAKCNVRESDIGSTTPVELYRSGVSAYGAYDLCGNVWEWCSTQTSTERYVLKGGAFTSPFQVALPAATNDAAGTMRDDDTGFRCACDETTINQLFSD